MHYSYIHPKLYSGHLLAHMHTIVIKLLCINRYELMENEDINQIRLWTKSPIYFILPAEVFQYASLLFNHHSLSGLVTNLIVKLPYECCNGTSDSSKSAECQATCNNKYFDVLTNKVSYSWWLRIKGHHFNAKLICNMQHSNTIV